MSVPSLAVGVVAASLTTALPPGIPEMLTRYAPRPAMLYHLDRSFGERPRWEAVLPRGARAEFTISDAGTWTMLITPAGGNTCIMASGKDWRRSPVDPLTEE